MSSVAAPIPTTTKTCTACFERQPITEFRRRRRNSEDRQTQCRRCTNKAESARRKAIRRRKVCTYARDVLAAKRNRGRVVALTEQLASKIGGIEKIGALFKEALDGARAAGRHYTVLQLLRTILDLTIVSGQLEREQVRQMSDEDLQAELLRGSIRAVQENPHLAVLAAHQLGWTVIPPDEVKDIDT